MQTTDLRDYTDLRRVGAPRRPVTERRLGEFLGAVTEALTATFDPQPGEQALAVRCLGRHKPRCSGRIQAVRHGEEAAWRCPMCGDAGRISHGSGSPWDLSAVAADGFPDSPLASVRLAGPVLEAVASIPLLDRETERVLASGRLTGARAVVLRAPEAWLAHLAEYVASEVNHVDDDPQYVRRLDQALDALARFK